MIRGQEYTQFLRDSNLLGNPLSLRDAMVAFSHSRDLNFDDDFVLGYPSFLECTARLANLCYPSLPTLNERLEKMVLQVTKDN